jgi:site-specific recombinase XerC
MRVEDVYTQKRRTWVRLREKGGKRHEVPCPHNLEAYLHAYVEGVVLGGNPKNFLFPTALGRTGSSHAAPWRSLTPIA